MGDGFQEEICSEQKLHENAHSEGASQVSLSAGRLLVRGCAIEMAMALTLGSLKIHGSLMSQGSSPKQEAIFLLMFTW